MIKSLMNVTSTQMIWSIHFVYFQSGLKNGIMFWGGQGKSVKMFQIQKKVIRLLTGVHKLESWRHIFRKFQNTNTGLTVYFGGAALCRKKVSREFTTKVWNTWS